MKILFGALVVSASLGLGAVSLRGDTAMPLDDGPVPFGSVQNGATQFDSMQCPGGVCAPRRVTNGFYPTRWRKWPVETPAAPGPGVREAIGAPEFELPDPERETDLPQGMMTAPSPSDSRGAPPDSAVPRRSGPTAPSPQTAPRTVPRTGPAVPGLPRELQNELPSPRTDGDAPQFPFDSRPSRSAPALVARPKSHSATVLELAPQRAADNRLQSDHDVRLEPPSVLPSDETEARPLPSLAPAVRRTSHEQLESSDFPALREATRRTIADGAQQTQARPAVYEADIRSIGVWVNAAPNSAAALESGLRMQSPKLEAPGSMRSEGGPELSIATPNSPTTLAVRNVADDTWNSAAQVTNPLRDRANAGRVMMETSPASDGTAPTASASREPNIPVNPLRKR